MDFWVISVMTAFRLMTGVENGGVGGGIQGVREETVQLTLLL